MTPLGHPKILNSPDERPEPKKFPPCPYCENGVQQVGPEHGMVEPCFCEAGAHVAALRWGER
jgi:hypothetical protein